AFLAHASFDRPPEYMAEKLHVMDNGLWRMVLRSKVGHCLLKDGRGHGVQGLPCQAFCPPPPVVPLVGDGRRLLATGGERGKIASNHSRRSLFPSMLIPFRKEAALLLFLFRFPVKVSGFRLVLE